MFSVVTGAWLKRKFSNVYKSFKSVIKFKFCVFVLRLIEKS